MLNLIKNIRKANIEINETFKYFVMGLKNMEQLPKDRFLLVYQSVAMKSSIVDVNNLYSYLDDNKAGFILLSKW
jgi:hypothetical protein